VRDARGLPGPVVPPGRARLSVLWHPHALAARIGTALLDRQLCFVLSPLILSCGVCGVHVRCACACAVVGQVVPWHGLVAVLSRPAEWAHVAFAGTLTLTPWNSLRYNMQVDNLSTRAWPCLLHHLPVHRLTSCACMRACVCVRVCVWSAEEHGIHPHYTHALVNFPLVYGPLALAACANGIRFVWSLLAGTRGQPDSATTALRRRGRWVLALSIVSGLGILSLAPHQVRPPLPSDPCTVQLSSPYWSLGPEQLPAGAAIPGAAGAAALDPVPALWRR
jgi:hypothetical protein